MWCLCTKLLNCSQTTNKVISSIVQWGVTLYMFSTFFIYCLIRKESIFVISISTSAIFQVHGYELSRKKYAKQIYRLEGMIKWLKRGFVKIKLGLSAHAFLVHSGLGVYQYILKEKSFPRLNIESSSTP